MTTLLTTCAIEPANTLCSDRVLVDSHHMDKDHQTLAEALVTRRLEVSEQACCDSGRSMPLKLHAGYPVHCGTMPNKPECSAKPHAAGHDRKTYGLELTAWNTLAVLDMSCSMRVAGGMTPAGAAPGRSMGY